MNRAKVTQGKRCPKCGYRKLAWSIATAASNGEGKWKKGTVLLMCEREWIEVDDGGDDIDCYCGHIWVPRE